MFWKLVAYMDNVMARFLFENAGNLVFTVNFNIHREVSSRFCDLLFVCPSLLKRLQANKKDYYRCEFMDINPVHSLPIAKPYSPSVVLACCTYNMYVWPLWLKALS